MATGIDKNNAVIPFTMTANNSLSRSGGHGTFQPSTGIVTFFAYFFASSSISQSATVATIPLQFRPTAQRTVESLVQGTNQVFHGGSGKINTDGTVNQNVLSTAKTGYVFGTYQI